MPLYEFSCKKCGHHFDELLSLSELEQGKVKCPACNSKQVVRGFSTFAKGSSDSLGGSGGGCGSGGGGFT